LKPSANFSGKESRVTGRWLDTTAPAEEYLNALMSVIHPDLHAAGERALDRLRKQDSTSEIACKWTSIFTGIQTISNRVTPSHRDSRGRPQWYDLITVVGTGSAAKLILPGLGVDLAYTPGAVVGLCGSIIEHEVKHWGSGDRVCYAHFMRKAVLERLGCHSEAWVNIQMYRGHA